jgi:nitrogen regulatory protein P-II 1
MQALFIVVHDPDHLHDVLTGLVEIGITTATILESQGMGSVVSASMSVFAGFRDLWAGSGKYNYTVFAVLEDEMVDEAVRVTDDIMRGFPEKGKGVMFTLPVGSFRKFAGTREKTGS